MRARILVRSGPCLVLAAVLMLGAVPGWAQTVVDATITGTVYLPTGETQAGVVVQLTGPALVTGERTAVSGGGGRFVFLSVPPGTYELTVKLEGFKTATETGMVVGRGASVDVPVHLQMGTLEEEIVVTSVSPMVNTRSSTIDTTFSDEMLQKVPTARNAFYDLALTAPGMAATGAEDSWLPSPAAYGSAASNNITLVNGVNTTNPRGSAWGSLVRVNYSTVEEVKVLSLGSKAEYGSFSGAAIDVITKSGGNQLHGDAAFYSMIGNAGDNWTASAGKDWMFVDPNLEIVAKPKTNDDISLTVGGPLMKDKLWFYFGYAKTKWVMDTPLRPVDESTDADLYDLKLTGDFGANHRLWLGLHYEKVKNGGTTWGNGWDSSMIYGSDIDNLTPQLQYQWLVTGTDILSLKYLAFDTDQTPTIPGEVGHPGYVNWWKWLPIRDMGLNGDFPWVESEKSNRQTIQADWTHYASDFLGEHDMKFGVQITKGEGNWLGGYFQNYANFTYPYGWGYSYAPIADWWWNCNEDWCWGSDANPVVPFYNRVVELNPWLTVRKSDSTGVFVDDTWVVNDRLTFDLGLRYDRMTAKYGTGYIYEPFATPASVNNPTVQRSREGTGNIFDFKTWSPRIGLAYTLTEDRKTVLRAHLGRYYAPLGVDSLRRFGPDMDSVTQNTWIYYLPASIVDVNGNGFLDPAETPIGMRAIHGREPTRLLDSSTQDPSWELEVGPGTGSPYTDQFNVSLQRQLASDLAVEVSFIYKREQDLLALQAYNTQTGEPYEWESLPFTTWTGYETRVWQVVPRDYTGDGVVNGEDWAFVGNNRRWRTVNADVVAGRKIDRTFTGLQLVLNKRYSNRWQMMAAINWTNTDGTYPRTVDQNWYIDGPLVMDTPFGGSRNDFQNNLGGPAGMTPEWMLKLAGSFTIPTIETDFGFRFRWDSGRAMYPVQDIPIYASWMGEPQPGVYLGLGWRDKMVATSQDNPDWMPATTIIDLSLQKSFRLGDVGYLAISFDALNALNAGAPNRVVYSQANYGLVSSLITPRTYRGGIKFSF